LRREVIRLPYKESDVGSSPTLGTRYIIVCFYNIMVNVDVSKTFYQSSILCRSTKDNERRK
jgi:hypothetical protein